MIGQHKTTPFADFQTPFPESPGDRHKPLVAIVFQGGTRIEMPAENIALATTGIDQLARLAQTLRRRR